MIKPGGAIFILLLGTVFACGSFGADFFAPVQPLIAEDMQASAFSVQLIMSSFFIGHAAAQLVFGPLSDRFGRKPVLRVGLWLFAGAALACSLAPSMDVLIGLRFIQGLAAAAATVVARAVARDHFDGPALGRAMSYMSLTVSLSPILLPPLSGMLGTTFGWQSCFIALAVVVAVIALALEAGYREEATKPHQGITNPLGFATAFVKVSTTPVFLGFMVTGCLCFAGLFAFISNSSFIFRDYFGASMTDYGMFLGLTFVAHAVGVLVSARLVPTLGGLKLIAVGAAICCLSGSALAACSLLGRATGPTIFVLMSFYLFGAGLVYPQSLAGALQAFPRLAGTASAIMGFTVMVMASGASALVGALYTGTPTALAVVVALSGTTAFAFFMVFARRHVAQGQK